MQARSCGDVEVVEEVREEPGSVGLVVVGGVFTVAGHR